MCAVCGKHGVRARMFVAFVQSPEVYVHDVLYLGHDPARALLGPPTVAQRPQHHRQRVPVPVMHTTRRGRAATKPAKTCRPRASQTETSTGRLRLRRAACVLCRPAPQQGLASCPRPRHPRSTAPTGGPPLDPPPPCALFRGKAVPGISFALVDGDAPRLHHLSRQVGVRVNQPKRLDDGPCPCPLSLR